MTEQEQKEIVRLTVEKFIEHQQKAKTEEKSQWLHNTRLLMRNYNLLNKHAKQPIITISDALKADNIFNRPDKEISISNIKQSAAETYIIMQHVNTMLKILSEDCKQANQDRKYRVFRDHYIHKIPYRLIAKREEIEERTAYRDTGDMLERLSILLFGISELIKK